MAGLDTLLAQTGVRQDVEGSLAIGAREAKKQRDREAAKAFARESRETAWAAYHLNFPQNTRGFGPWANEQQSFSEKRGGSILGLGILDNPFSQTEAERGVERAKTSNHVREAVRDLFNRGATKAEIAGELTRLQSGFTMDLGLFGTVTVPARPEVVPRDLREHYLR